MRDFCCSNIELVKENEVVDTYGDNFTYRDTYVCKECNKVFYVDINDYTCNEQLLEETDEAEIEYIMGSY